MSRVGHAHVAGCAGPSPRHPRTVRLRAGPGPEHAVGKSCPLGHSEGGFCVGWALSPTRPPVPQTQVSWWLPGRGPLAGTLLSSAAEEQVANPVILPRSEASPVVRETGWGRATAVVLGPWASLQAAGRGVWSPCLCLGSGQVPRGPSDALPPVGGWTVPQPAPQKAGFWRLLSCFSAEGLWVKHFGFLDLNFLSNKMRN